MYLYLKDEEVRVVYALLLEKALWLSNKRIDLIKNDKEDTPEYANLSCCAYIVDDVVRQIEELKKTMLCAKDPSLRC